MLGLTFSVGDNARVVYISIELEQNKSNWWHQMQYLVYYWPDNRYAQAKV